MKPGRYAQASTLLLFCSLFTTVNTGTAIAADNRDSPYGSKHPEAPEELEQFAFMIGEFSRRDRFLGMDGVWSDWQAGEWNARYFMNGHGIIDETMNYVSGQITTNIRIYDEDAGNWKVTWIKLPGYSILESEGGMEGDKMVINQAGGQKYVFSDISENFYRWTLYTPFNGELLAVREIEVTRK